MTASTPASDPAEQNLKRKRKSPPSGAQQQGNAIPGSKPRPRGSGLGPKRVACEPCRRRRIRCRHKDDPFNLENRAFGQPFADLGLVNMGLAGATDMYTMDGVLAGLGNPVGDAMSPGMGGVAGSTSIKKGRSKACDECRRSKRRCIHDEHGRIDPIKAQEKSKPRASTLAKQRNAAIEEFNSMKQMFRKEIPVQGMEHHLMSPEMTARAALGLAGTLEVPPQSQQQMYASPPSVKAEMDSNMQQPAGVADGSHLGIASLVSPPTSLADDTD
ncbi:JmjC domain-containing histone demethylation protein 1, partial [Ascosphaera aggregata]